jgi:hypothetical protein
MLLADDDAAPSPIDGREDTLGSHFMRINAPPVPVRRRTIQTVLHAPSHPTIPG